MKYELKRFSCKSGCQRRDKCAKMPLEISMNGKKNVDVMFVTEFPGKEECDENRFLTGKYGIPFRNILNKLSENYHFSYAIAGLFKSKSTEDVMKTSYRSICICRDEVLKREINFVKPKVIVVMGKYAYKFLMGKNPKYGMLVEHGRLVPANVLGHECEVVSVQHTTWYVKNDSCVIGFLYEEIRKTLDYVLKGIDYRIPNNFESVTLRTLRDVKNVFNDMKKSKQYVASDTEDDNLNIVYSNNLISLQVCNDGKTGFVIPVIHFDSPFKGRKLDELKNLIYDFYTDKSANILGHIWVNAKFDYHQLIRECKVLEINAPFIDCSFAEYSLEETWSRIRGFPHQKGHFSLFTMAYSRGFSFYDETSSKEKRTILSHLPLKEWEDYGGADVVAPWQIYQSQLRQAETQGYLHNFKKLNERFYTHMCRSTTYVEHCGLSLDYEVLQQLNSNDSIFKAAKDEVMDKFYESEFVLKANDILSKKMKGIAARGLFGTSRIFNPSKSTHRELLYFDVMNLEPVEDTDGKKENHTDKAFQKEYENIPEVSLLTEFNSIVKMQTGFVTPVATWMDKRNPDKREDFLDFRSRGSFMNDAVTGRLKCVTLDTMVYAGKKFCTMKEVLNTYNPLLKEDQRVKLPVRNSLGVETAKSLLYIGKKPIVDVTTKSGYHVGTTKETPMLVLNKDFTLKWIKAGDLKLGDTLCIVPSNIKKRREPKLNTPSKYFHLDKEESKWKYFPKKMSVELARILGYLGSEGNQLSFGQKDKYIMDDFIHCWKQVFGIEPNISIEERVNFSGEKITFYTSYIKGNRLCAFFDGIGYNTNSTCYNKNVPWSIHQASTKSILNYLASYIEGDGWGSDKSRVNICTVSKDMAIGLQQLLLQIGVISHIRPTKRNGLLYIDISGINCDRLIQAFRENKVKIPNKLKEIQKSSDKNGGKNNFIPYIFNSIPKEIKQYLNNKDCNSLNRKSIPDRFIHELKQHYNSVYRTLKYIIDYNIYFDDISTLKQNRVEEVADFTMQVTNNFKITHPEAVKEGHFIANGLVIHNCVKPNNQQRPSRGKQVNTILSMYKAPKERVCIKLDYKTFEVKGLGFMSGDKIMVSSFTEMHNLVKEFRKNPTIFTDNGYNEALGTLKNRKKELVERKKALSCLKGRDRDNAKKSYLEEVEKYKKDRASLKDSYENDRIALSMTWLTNQIDFHRKSASLFNGVSLTEVTKAMRQKAKGLVFGCFTSDTIVTTENGAYRVKNIIDNKLPVQSINCEIKDSDGAISKGEKPTVRVLTRRGVLKATSGHHVLTVSKDCTLEMKPCGLLEEKDVVVWQRGVFGDAIPQIENKNLTLEDVEAMGLFTGDGSAGIYDRQNYRIHHCSIDRKEVKKVRDFITKLSGIKPKIVKYKSKSTHVLNVKIKSYPKDMYQFSINNKKAYTKLLDFGLLGKQKVRRVPDQILRAKPEYVSAYLRGYFDADGGIRNSSKKRNQIFLSSVNYDLLYDVVYLLGMFNISSSVYRNGDYFELIITNSVSMLRFYKEIGFGTKVKQNKLKEWCKQISKDVSDKTKYPFSTKELNKKYSKHAGVNTFRSRSVYVNNTLIKPLKKPIQYVIDHIDEYHDSFMALNMKEEWDCLKLLSNKDVRLSEVFEAPVDNGIEEVFDVVNVKDYHKWVANGIVVSNSIYGRGVKSIARELGISEEEAQKYQDLFKANMPEACAWLENSQKFARKHMYVESPLGRRRRLWGYLLEDKRATSQMDRYAINTVIQGVCSDENLIASSLLISFIFAHGKAITQTTPEKAWMLTNLVHDSTEMEVPLEDLYYVLSTFESWYTTKLTYFNKKMFDFDIAIPLEVDMGVGIVYNNIIDWNGSDIHAKELQKWVIKEHNVMYNDNKKAKKVMINHPFFEEYKNTDKKVLKDWCKRIA